jgi:hypothetical protein
LNKESANQDLYARAPSEDEFNLIQKLYQEEKKITPDNMTHIFMKDTKVDSHMFMHANDQAADKNRHGLVTGGLLMNKAV